MTKFKKGDRVVCIKGDYNISVGDIGTVMDNSHIPYVQVDGRKGLSCAYQSSLEPYEPKETHAYRLSDPVEFKSNKPRIMKAIQNLFLPKKIKTLIEAGFMSDSLELTQEGLENLQAISLEANQDALVKKAEEKIAKKK